MKQYLISRDGWTYLASLAGLTVVAGLISIWLAIVPFVLLLFVAFFFRNPQRTIPSDESLLVAPADGVVLDVSKVVDEFFFQGECIRVRIFLSIFNVHVNRAPIAGRIIFTKYKEGLMIPAFKDHASELNERNYVGIENSKLRVLVVQITGFIARRIVCWNKEGDILERGERFGLIKFGSCTELYLPLDVQVLVNKGDKVRGGETVVGRVNEHEQ